MDCDFFMFPVMLALRNGKAEGVSDVYVRVLFKITVLKVPRSNFGLLLANG